MAYNNYPKAHTLLEKYQTGTCTPEEIGILESWYQGQGSSEEFTPQESEDLHRYFLDNFRNRSANKAKNIPLHVAVLRWMAAACVLLLAGLGYLWMNAPSPEKGLLVSNKSFYIKNESSHVRRVVLSDSSVVWLNAYASLQWGDDYNSRKRSVRLTGEGFFDVHRNSEKPFTIHTRDLNIDVLGTAFNVEAYSNEELTRVSLVKGSVRVSAVTDSTVQRLLRPGYAATLVNGVDIQINETDAGMTAGWTAGGFVIKDLSLKNAMERVCERNGYHLIWENTQDILKNISVSYTREDFKQIIANLCYMSHKGYKISKNQVTIY